MGLSPDLEFWKGLDYSDLKTRYNSAPLSAFRSIVPVWDMRPGAISHNPVVPEAIDDAKLYIATREALIANCPDRNIYTHERFRDHSTFDRILRVIGHWEKREPLTPPLFWLSDNQEIAKVDGHHRITVALLSGASRIPLYCQEDLQLVGIPLATLPELETAAWSAPL